MKFNMEGNKDESEHCLSLAEKFINEGQRDKAAKYLHKAEKLYPSQRAKDLLEFLNKVTSDYAPKENGDVNNVHKRKKSNGAAVDNDESRESPTAAPKSECTAEQLEAVTKVKKCKDYYEMLGVSKEATADELKKQYKKLAFLLHPDKNSAAGAKEAFTAVGNAFQTLSDSTRKRNYDLRGPEEEQKLRSAQRRNSHTRGGYDTDMSAEELFNVFFGNAFNGSNVYVRRGNTWSRYREAPAQNERNENSYSAALQLLPILLLIALSLTSSLFMSEPPYSLQRTAKYSIGRQTQNLRIPYYVRDTFAKEYKHTLRRVEDQVEDDYLNNLRTACFREMNYKETLLWRARSYGDGELLQKANSLKTPSCDSLKQHHT